MKRCANEEEDKPSSKMACRESIDKEPGECHKKEMVAWDAVQNFVDCTKAAKYNGTISTEDAAKSYKKYKLDLQQKGYKFGEYKTERTLFEKLGLKVFDRLLPEEEGTPNEAHVGRAAFNQAKSLLTQINNGCKPEEDTIKPLVQTSIEYITPVGNMVLLLSHPLATKEDLDLFWELTDRLWCYRHPVYQQNDDDLDATCDKITKRLQQVTAADTAPVKE